MHPHKRRLERGECSGTAPQEASPAPELPNSHNGNRPALHTQVHGGRIRGTNRYRLSSEGKARVQPGYCSRTPVLARWRSRVLIRHSALIGLHEINPRQQGSGLQACHEADRISDVSLRGIISALLYTIPYSLLWASPETVVNRLYGSLPASATLISILLP